MFRIPSYWPLPLQELLFHAQVKEKRLGRLGNVIFLLRDIHLGECYLNVASGYVQYELRGEYRFLSGDTGNLPVAKVLFYTEEDSVSYLLTTYLRGKPLHQVLSQFTPTALIDFVGKTLFDIMRLPCTNVGNGLQEELEQVKGMLERGEVDAERFQQEMKRQPEKMFVQLVEEAKGHSNTVYTHGDYCLPNLLVEDKKLSGIIDWGKSGRGDVCRDLSALEGSMRYNVGYAAMEEICQAAGLIDTAGLQEKRTFYQKLDQYWYCLQAK